MKAVARPRRGAPPKGEVSARERILATASELFYREGIRAIGVDTVVERSGVSKTSLYRLFESKDALIAAFAAEQDRAPRLSRLSVPQSDDGVSRPEPSRPGGRPGQQGGNAGEARDHRCQAWRR